MVSNICEEYTCCTNLTDLCLPLSLKVSHTSVRVAAPTKTDDGLPVNFAPPDIPVPPGVACSVPLFSHVFNDTVAHEYAYPDVAKLCGDHWSKVVLDLQCGVTPGGQYDRSLFVFLKGVNIFAGTSEEPNHSSVGPSWRVQADLSHYGVGLLAGAGSGSVELDNIQSEGRDALPHCVGSLRFFKATETYPPFEELSNHIVSLGTSYRNANGTNTNRGNNSLTAIVAALPKNTVRAELEIILQNQAGEEGFWGRPKSAWRAALVRIDGVPVGAISAYPIVFTGGYNRALWQPAPGESKSKLPV